MNKISACLIVRDGAETLDKALASLDGYADEIVVCIDTRTADDSEAIARNYTDNIYSLIWSDDFSAARNFAASKASHDWILVIDADDSLEPKKGSILHDAISKEPSGIRFIVKTSPTTHVGSIRCYNKNTSRYVYRVHEYLKISPDVPNPIVIDVPITITHERGGKCIEPGRNFKILSQALSEYPRYLFYAGRECIDNNQFDDAIKYFEQYIPLSSWPAEKAEALIGIARAYVHKNNLNLAKEYCFRASLVEPHFAPTYNLLGQISLVQQDYHSSVLWFEHSLKCQNIQYVFNDVESIKFNNWGNLIVAYARVGDIAGARMAVIKAEAIIPGSAWIQEQTKRVNV